MPYERLNVNAKVEESLSSCRSEQIIDPPPSLVLLALYKLAMTHTGARPPILTASIRPACSSFHYFDDAAGNAFKRTWLSCHSDKFVCKLSSM